jgi:hypothetical protein
MPEFLSLSNAGEPNADDLQAFEASIYSIDIEPLTIKISRNNQLAG